MTPTPYSAESAAELARQYGAWNDISGSTFKMDARELSILLNAALSQQAAPGVAGEGFDNWLKAWQAKMGPISKPGRAMARDAWNTAISEAMPNFQHEKVMTESGQEYSQWSAPITDAETIASQPTEAAPGVSGGLIAALKNHMPYKDESGIISFALHDYGRILQLAEQADKPIKHDWNEDVGQLDGTYSHLCDKCGHLFIGHKTRSECKRCASQPHPTGDTLQEFIDSQRPLDGEAAKVLYENLWDLYEGETVAGDTQQEAYCPHCNGSGEAMLSGGAGPDSYDELGSCPECGGTGALLDTYRLQIVELERLRVENLTLQAKAFTHPPAATALAQEVKDKAVDICNEANNRHSPSDYLQGDTLTRRLIQRERDTALSIREAIAAIPIPIPEPRPDALVAMAYMRAADECALISAGHWWSYDGKFEPQCKGSQFSEGAAHGAEDCEQAVAKLTPPEAQAALEELCLRLAQEIADNVDPTGVISHDEITTIVRATLNQHSQKD